MSRFKFTFGLNATNFLLNIFCFQYFHPKLYESYIHEERRACLLSSSSDDLNPDQFTDVTFRIICKSYFRILAKTGDNITAECRLCTESKILQTNRNQSYSFTRHLRVCVAIAKRIINLKKNNTHQFISDTDNTSQWISTICGATSTKQTWTIGKHGEQICK